MNTQEVVSLPTTILEAERQRLRKLKMRIVGVDKMSSEWKNCVRNCDVCSANIAKRVIYYACVECASCTHAYEHEICERCSHLPLHNITCPLHQDGLLTICRNGNNEYEASITIKEVEYSLLPVQNQALLD